ncbi:MAG TPA: crotonase/enoyl-CoA hydratase family protein [Burkholderiales bacterium]|nr:crotonase/enoyl-CoA hydratase family protein [Burkholderiales bacterium]
MNMHVSHELLRAPQVFPGREIDGGIEISFSPQLRAYYQKELGAIWSRWSPNPRPCLNPQLLSDLLEYCDFLKGSDARVICGGEAHPIDYVVIASDVPGVFNLGGDLDLFIRLIESRDRDGLLRYGRACVDVQYRNYLGHDLPVTTVALVQGECLGGGFEGALSSEVIVAEKSARFGFPEVLFNMFPGMGAYSFLSRRVGDKAATEIIGSGKVYSADDMLAAGVIDAVAEDGRGEAEVASLIKRRGRSRNGLAGLAAVRRRVVPIDYSELLDVVCIWVDTAMRLNPRDIKLMQKLVSRQNDMHASTQIH